MIFFLMDHWPHGFISAPANPIDQLSLDDDLILYFMDTLKWVPAFSPSRAEPRMDLCYHGVTVIRKEGATVLNTVMRGWRDIFLCAPDIVQLTGNDVLDDERGYSFGTLICTKSNLITVLNGLIRMSAQVIEGRAELYILHRGI